MGVLSDLGVAYQTARWRKMSNLSKDIRNLERDTAIQYAQMLQRLNWRLGPSYFGMLMGIHWLRGWYLLVVVPRKCINTSIINTIIFRTVNERKDWIFMSYSLEYNVGFRQKEYWFWFSFLSEDDFAVFLLVIEPVWYSFTSG